VLRAHPPAHLRQRVGLVAQRGSLEDAAFLDQPEPVGDVVVHRALRLAVRVAAVEATAGLQRGPGLVEAPIQLAPVAGKARLQRHLLRHAPLRVEELEGVAPAHQAALRSSSASASRLAAFGLTSQNLPTKSRNSSRIRALHALPVRLAWVPIRPMRCWRWFSKPSGEMRTMSISSRL